MWLALNLLPDIIWSRSTLIYFKTKLIIILLIFLKWHQSTTWEFDESVTDFSSLQNTLGWLIDGTPTDAHLFIDDHMENLPLYNPEFT